MNINNKNKISNNPNFIQTNINPTMNFSFNSNSNSLNPLTNFRGGVSKKILNSIEHLNVLSFDSNFLSLGKENVSNSIKNKKLIKSETKVNLKQEETNSSDNYNTVLTFSNLIKKTEVKASESNLAKLSLKATKLTESKISDKLESEIMFAATPKMEKSGLFMSLNSHNDYYFYLSYALNILKETKGNVSDISNLKSDEAIIEERNKLISYKIRHYLNLITKFNFNLSTSYYEFFQFKRNKKYLFKMEKATELLKIAFLTKGCLISKPIFNIVYPLNSLLNEENEITLSSSKNKNLNKPKIIIQLFYFVKTRVIFNELVSSVIQPSSLNETTESNDSNSITEATTNLNLIDLNVKMAHMLRKQENDRLIITNFKDKFIYLCDYLTKLFNFEVELELVRLYKPYQDSNILAQYLNSKSYSRKFIRLVSRLFRRLKIYKRKNNFIKPSVQELKGKSVLNATILNEAVAFPSGISGVNIKLAGRPIKERIIPRFTVKRAQRGNFDRLNAKMIEKSMFTDKTKKGAFNFTVRLSHIFR